MKATCTVLLISFITALSTIAFAQQARPSAEQSFYVLNQSKVALDNISKLNALSDSVFAPVLNELVKEGKLADWGQLIHAWGDEWNYNYYFITQDQRAFLNFWDEYVSRVSKRFPGSMQKVASLIIAHKDNMYNIRKVR